MNKMNKSIDINKETKLNNIDFKELSKTCKNEKDISSLTKEFMKNSGIGKLMPLRHKANYATQNMLNSKIEEHIECNEDSSNRNGYYKKTVKSDNGNLELDIPRDRTSSYQPGIIPKGRTTISGIDNKIISLYARGMSLRDIEKQIKEMYDIDISDSLISKIIDKILPEMRELSFGYLQLQNLKIEELKIY